MLALWTCLTLMLVDLGRTLHRVSQAHLAERGILVQALLPLLAIAAAGFCVVRARHNVIEILDIRREQADVTARLRAMAAGEEDGDHDSTPF